jgi:hypothetical protein
VFEVNTKTKKLKVLIYSEGCVPVVQENHSLSSDKLLESIHLMDRYDSYWNKFKGLHQL